MSDDSMEGLGVILNQQMCDPDPSSKIAAATCRSSAALLKAVPQRGLRGPQPVSDGTPDRAKGTVELNLRGSTQQPALPPSCGKVFIERMYVKENVLLCTDQLPDTCLASPV